MAILSQLQNDFQDDGDHCGWFNDPTHLHVHFGFADEVIELSAIKNLMALYGLFEEEIERWHPAKMRDDRTWCKRLRVAMETHSWDESNTFIYTPQEFTQKIYETDHIRRLKRVISGIPTKEMQSNFVAVNISRKRPNKPTTIEFRQHRGTIDPEEIKWWVQFCGHLMRFSSFLAKMNFQVNDIMTGGKTSLVDSIGRQSILDIIGFPEEGKQYFRREAEIRKHYAYDAWRVLDRMLVEKRIAIRKAGGEMNREVDQQLRSQPWYHEALKNLNLVMRDGQIMSRPVTLGVEYV